LAKFNLLLIRLRNYRPSVCSPHLFRGRTIWKDRGMLMPFILRRYLFFPPDLECFYQRFLGL
jgi:hypothetical protein